MTSTQEKPYIGNDKLIISIVLGVITFWLFAQSLSGIGKEITEDLQISFDSFNLALSLTALFSGCFIVVAGGIADKIGCVKVTQFGLLLSIIGCLLLIFANGAMLFSIGRIVQGLSAACIMPATLAIIKAYYAGKQRQRALSFWSFGSWGGSGICLLAGGAISTYCGWRWIFIISIICAVLSFFWIKGTPETKVDANNNKKFDFFDLFLFVVMLMTLNILITKGSAYGWTSMITLIIVAAFLLSTCLFFHFAIKKKTDAFIDFSLFKNKAYSGAVCSNFMLNAVAGTLPVASIYLQQGRGFTAFQSGLLTIGYLIAVLSMIRVGEKILQNSGARKPMIWGTIINAIGVALMMFTFLPTIPYNIAVFVGYILFGLGLGFYATPSTDTAVSHSPANKVAMGSGIYKMASALGGAFGVAISTTVYTAFAIAMNADIAAAAGFFVNVVFAIFAIIAIVLLLPKENRKL